MYFYYISKVGPTPYLRELVCYLEIEINGILSQFVALRLRAFDIIKANLSSDIILIEYILGNWN